MGSFDSTCAITNMDIHKGDPVVIVIDNYNMVPSAYRTSSSLFTVLGEEKRRKEMYEEVGIPFPSDEPSLLEKFQILEGHYNNYGWIKEESVNSTWFRKNQHRYFMVHRVIWDNLAGSLDHEGLAKLLDFAHLARIQLFWPDHLLGEQYATPRSWNARRKVLQMTIELIDKREAKWQGNWLDNVE